MSALRRKRVGCRAGLGASLPCLVVLSISRLERFAPHTIRPVASREKARSPLISGRAALCRRLASCRFQRQHALVVRCGTGPTTICRMGRRGQPERPRTPRGAGQGDTSGQGGRIRAAEGGKSAGAQQKAAGSPVTITKKGHGHLRDPCLRTGDEGGNPKNSNASR